MAPPASFPLSVLHRIQSVDLGSYLELYDVDDKSIVMRPISDSLEQQWTFVPSTTKGSYIVMSAATQFLQRPRYLSVTPGNANATATTNAKVDSSPQAVTTLKTAKSWEIRPTDKEGISGIFIFACQGADEEREIFLFTNKTGETGTLEEAVSNNTVFHRSRKWRVLEVSPSVPKDNYRIRTLNGTALQMKPGTGVLSVEPLAKGKQQEWEVEPQGNGKCTIKSISEKVYLGWETSKGDYAKVAKSPSPLVWTVQSLGEFTYSITMKCSLDDQTSALLALTCGNNNEIILKPRKVAHNRIWLFEAVDVTVEADTPSPPPYELSRCSEISAKAYYLRNIGTGSYVYAQTGPWRFNPGIRVFAISVTYTGSGGNLTLQYGGVCFSSAGDILTADNTAVTEWILEREKDPTGAGYCYFICLAKDARLVVSGDTRNDINGYPLFTLVQKQKGYTRHQWKFED